MLASLPLKSCSYCSPDRRCFETLSWGQTIFTSHQVKQLLNGRGHLWMSDQRIFRYQVVLMKNSGLIMSSCEVLNPATLLPTPKGSLPFHSCLETLDHWTKPWEGLSEDPLTYPEEIWYTDGSNFVFNGKRRAGYAVVSNFEAIEVKPLPPGTSVQLAELMALTWAIELGKEKGSHLHWLHICLSGATCTCRYLERKRPFDHPRILNQVWWSKF